jgi:hypothetical protein
MWRGGREEKGDSRGCDGNRFLTYERWGNWARAAGTTVQPSASACWFRRTHGHMPRRALARASAPCPRTLREARSAINPTCAMAVNERTRMTEVTQNSVTANSEASWSDSPLHLRKALPEYAPRWAGAQRPAWYPVSQRARPRVDQTGIQRRTAQLVGGLVAAEKRARRTLPFSPQRKIGRRTPDLTSRAKAKGLPRIRCRRRPRNQVSRGAPKTIYSARVARTLQPHGQCHIWLQLCLGKTPSREQEMSA